MDKEKLIAARKRLKEYQRNKKENIQENSSNHQNESTKKTNNKTNETSVNHTNINTFPKNEISIESSTEQIASVNFFDTNENENTVPNMSSPQIDFLQTKSDVSYNFEHQLDQNLNRKALFHNESQKEVNDYEKTYQQIQDNNINPHYDININPSSHEEQIISEFDSIKDSFTVQKEQISQMATAVADVLNDKIACNKSPESQLEHQNEILSANCDEQKTIVNQLYAQLDQYRIRISELETKLFKKDTEFEEKLQREINPLQGQLQIHAHTMGFLVAEKAELSAALNQSQTITQQKLDEIQELAGKLKSCQLRVSELEKDLSFVRSNNDDVQKTFQQLQNNYADTMNQFSELRKETEDLQLESSELRQKLNLRNTEMMNLQKELQEKTALLSLSELKIQQLTNSPQETQILENHQNVAAIYEQQIAKLKEMIKSLNDEKDEANKQYKNYVQQLDDKHTKISNELEFAHKRIAEFENREESYIQRLSDLEQQLQREKENVESLQPLQDHQERIDILTKNIDNLVLQQESLQMALNTKDAEIEQLKKELQELQESKQEEVDTSKLLFALESEQLGAARAVSQNQQLKNQLNEMHDAFVSLSNNKLDLTEQLQAERSIGKKLNAMLSRVEAELDDVKNQLVAKEAALLEFEKEKLQTAQIADQMQHYQAQSHHASTIQQELEKSLIHIESLKKENYRLNEKINIQAQTMINSEELRDSDDKINELLKTEVDKIDSNEIKIRKISTETQTSLQTEEDDSFSIPEPLKKLEVKFKNTMEQVAELTDEKQRLEHLVLQLQGETETIGEYITLYQKQRAILQERAKEREKAFRQLTEQRNHQQEQLHKLKVLVADLIKAKQNMPSNVANVSSVVINHESKLEENDVSYDTKTEAKTDLVLDGNDKMTSDILDLLTEIKDCNDTCIQEPNFHPCPWCSGKLITV